MHKKTSLAAALALATILVACGGGDAGTGPGEKTVVVVTPGTISKPAGYTTEFAATVNGTAATAGQVTWSSSNTAVATVSNSGIATAVAAGTATIRATSGSAFGEATMTVVANTTPTVSAGADVSGNRYSQVTLTASGTDAEGQPLTYRWMQISGPAVTGATSWTQPSLTVTLSGTVTVLRFTVVASDVALASRPDTVAVYVVEDAAKTVWVSPNGNDNDAGTRAAPMATITAAIARAGQNGADVYVTEGTYNERVYLKTDVSLYGGFASDWSARYPVSDATHRSVIHNEGNAMMGYLVQNVTVEGFALETPDAAPGASSYALAFETAKRVTFQHNAISAGAGGAGTAGAVGARGVTGQNGVSSTREIYPGAGGSGAGAGGRGGDASTPAAPGGSGDLPLGGPGGAAAHPPTPGANGAPGLAGATGAAGGGGAAFGSIGTDALYIPAGGGTGATGAPGGGGGGGGGGGNVFFFPVNYNGGGGGGGGAGGSGGTGGTGGTGGGGSFGIRLINSTDITFYDNTITTAAGGAGGVGGAGGLAGYGGSGGNGYDPSSANDGREGGRGGNGGFGGVGGQGGGGGGGPSVGLVVVGTSTFTDTGNAFTLGNGGMGGLPNGATGQSARVVTLP
ncbi:MAG TPA: Ig-like domain-containing protein [Gemmatimonadaceae bacterium]|nr:Ig-like domain-containing protein [Gemmatimonadaceae bacterium]